MALALPAANAAVHAGPPPPAGSATRVACDEAALRKAVAAAGASGGGTIRFDCEDTTIPMARGLGEIGDAVLLDGEGRGITLEFTADFAGCERGDNGIGGPPIARMAGRGSTFRGLTFRNWLESVQLVGTDNTVEEVTFLAHPCSDDAVSYIDAAAVRNDVRNSRFQGYLDKAIQMSSGGGTITGNSFLDCMQPVRGPDYGSGEFFLTGNRIETSGNRDDCAGVTLDGAHVVHLERNTLRCKRGLRLGGRVQAIVRDNVIEGNERVGVRIGGSAVASLAGNVVRNNGLVAGSLPAGGVVVWEEGRADLGGGTLVVGGRTISSPGGNVLRGNGVADVRNLRAGYLLRAEGNCWDGRDADAIRHDVEGKVDFEPFGGAGSTGSGGGPGDGCGGGAGPGTDSPR